MPANAFAEALQAAQEKALQTSGPPAPLTDDWNEPRPIAGTSAGSPMPDGPAGQAPLRSGCPYNPGDSGTLTVCGVDCGTDGAASCATWNEAQCIPWSLFGPGEYVGPARPEHVSSYYLRVNDLITLTFINSRRKDAERYRLGVGDRLKLEWLQAPSETDVTLDREITVQPDGTISLPLVGDVIADGKTVKELREELIRLYGRFQREPQITVTPIEVNTAIQDILSAVTSISGSNGQTQALRVTPEGTIQAPALGSVYVQGLTIEEARAELEARYAAKYGPGLMVSPSLTERAASFVFVGGEVQAPGRYTLEGPTTVMQAIALAGGWNNGGNLRQVVIFRRDENWCLKATKIDIRAPYFGNDPCPMNDVWLRDNDLVIVPKTKILCATDVINLYFTRGVYAAFPISYVYSFNTGSSVTPIVTPGP
jgi:polysaccharide export outer membrane protein